MYASLSVTQVWWFGIATPAVLVGFAARYYTHARQSWNAYWTRQEQAKWVTHKMQCPDLAPTFESQQLSRTVEIGIPSKVSYPYIPETNRPTSTISNRQLDELENMPLNLRICQI